VGACLQLLVDADNFPFEMEMMLGKKESIINSTLSLNCKEVNLSQSNIVSTTSVNPSLAAMCKTLLPF
jgi:hypothetical protein